MGTFLGHLVPGSFALTLGLYWSVQMWNIYFQCWSKGLKFVWVENIRNTSSKQLSLVVSTEENKSTS